MAHDLIPIHYPHYYPLNEQRAFEVALNNALAYATHIVCNSEWTAKDLRQYAKGKGNIPAVSVVPLAHEFIGFDRFTQIEASHELLYLAGKRFVLCVGTIEERKNFATLLEVWGKLLQGPETTIPMLVFAGKFGNGAESFQAALSGDSSLQHAVRVVYAPSDGQLAWLYQNSLFSVYPSKVEGWGLPVGESVWFGKYCVASNATSIPEVCGDLVDYVDPGDIEGLRRIVEHASSDAGFLKLREARIASATLRSWCDVADDIFKIVSGNGNAS
jgi:glycosyltransferase involved in cell wall biosynthesis